MAIRDKFEEAEKNGMKIVTNMNGEKRADDKLNARMTGIPKDLSYEDAVKTFEMSNDRRPSSIDELLDFFKNRKLNKVTTNTKTTA